MSRIFAPHPFGAHGELCGEEPVVGEVELVCEARIERASDKFEAAHGIGEGDAEPGVEQRVEGARGKGAQERAVLHGGAAFQARAEIEIVIGAVGDQIVDFFQMPEVGGEVDIHIADEIGIRPRPGRLQRQPETTLPDAQIADIVITRRERPPDFRGPVRRAVVRDAEFPDIEPLRSAIGDCALDGLRELLFLIENRKGDVDFCVVIHGAPLLHPSLSMP